MKARDTKVVLCDGIRTPIGHFSKSLSAVSPEHLLMLAINGLLAKTTLYPHAVDGVMAGWVGQGSHAPNIARMDRTNKGPIWGRFYAFFHGLGLDFVPEISPPRCVYA